MRIIIGADPHYLAPPLFKNSSLFREMTGYGDGKQMELIEEITDAFFYEVIKLSPDALIIVGDMAYKGEKESHLRFYAKLQKVLNEGIPVYVIPGNHDIDDPSARDYSGGVLNNTPNLSSEEFALLYAQCGINLADNGPGGNGSLSYTVDMPDGFRLILLDTCLYEKDRDLQPARAGGMVKPATLKWLELQLQKAVDDGVQPMVFSHHNLLEHNSIFYVGYTLSNADVLRELLSRYKVKLYFSGHMHIQSISTIGDIYEVASGSLTVYPNLYGILTAVNSQSIQYSAHSIDVAEWAKKDSYYEDDLLHFPARSRKYFRNLNFWKCYSELSALSIPEKECSTMAEIFSMANTAYFSGRMPEYREELLLLDGWELWETIGAKSAPFTKSYLDSMLALKSPSDQTTLSLKLD